LLYIYFYGNVTNMSAFDPVPAEQLVTSEIAERFIPVRFLNVNAGDATARELALQVLVDDDPNRQSEIKRYQQAGRGDITNFFRFMHDTIFSGVGRHTEHIIAVACLHPERDARLDITHATEQYLRAHGSLEDDVVATAHVLMGSFSIDAMMNTEENEAKVSRGELHRAPSPLN
jgi:hypothetical protein